MSQTAIIKGATKDSITGKAIEYANVVLYTAKDSLFVRGEITDSLGQFKFNNVTFGQYYVTVSLIGYKSLNTNSFETNVQRKEIDLAVLNVLEDINSLKAVTVSSEKNAFQRRSGKTILNVASNSLFKTSTNATDILRRAPGVRVDADGVVKLKNNIKPVVFINGKPIEMSDEELTAYLAALPQDQIESIEIIDNPSSKYDGEYKGIIDIKIKTDKNLGWNGDITTFAVKNTYLTPGSSGLNVTYKAKKCTFYTTYWYNNDKRKDLFQMDQFLNKSTQLLNYTGNEIRHNKRHSFQLGSDYLISSNQTIGILLKGYQFQSTRNTTSTSHLLSFPDLNEQSAVRTNNLQERNYNNYTVNVNYNADFKKSQLSGNVSYASYGSGENQNITNMESLKVDKIRNFTNSYIKIGAVQVDYTYSLGKASLELGAKYASTLTTNDLKYDTLGMASIWVDDPTRSNQFIYNENILAGYSNFSVPIAKKWKLQAGVRGEYTHSNGNSTTLNTHVDRTYIRPLPSINLNYTLNTLQSFDLSFSRRIERPSFSSLNPFQYYMSPYSYTEGNPFLVPTIINLFNLNYVYKNITTSITYNFYENIISQIPRVTDEHNTVYRIINFGKLNYLTWDINHTCKVKKWWSIQHYFALNYLKQNISYYTSQYKIENVSFYLSGSQVFNLPGNFVTEIRYSYNSRCKDNIYSIKEFYQVGVAVRKEFFRNSLIVKLNFDDVFYSNFIPLYADVENYNASLLEKHDTRLIKLMLTYKFGQSTFKRRERKSSSEEEENRSKK